MDKEKVMKNIFRLGELMANNKHYSDEATKLLSQSKYGEAAEWIDKQAGILLEMADMLRVAERESKNG